MLNVAGLPIRGVKGINFSESVERGKVRGTSQRKLALTSGEHDAEGGIELYQADWYELPNALGDGYPPARCLPPASPGLSARPVASALR